MQQAKATTVQKAQSFAFVEYHGPERGLSTSAESTIRRHAMKEIGKSRRKRMMVNAVELDICALRNDSEDLKQPSWWLGRIWRQAGSGILDPFVRYPVEIDPLARRLIANGKETAQKRSSEIFRLILYFAVFQDV